MHWIKLFFESFYKNIKNLNVQKSKIVMKSYKKWNSLSVSFSFEFPINLLNEKSLKQNFWVFREFSGGDFFSKKIKKNFFLKKLLKKKFFMSKEKSLLTSKNLKSPAIFVKVKNVFLNVFLTLTKIKVKLRHHKLLMIE